MGKIDSLEAAALSYVGAAVARRDARRLLDIGFEASTSEAFRALIPATLETAIGCVAAKEAMALVELYDSNPEKHPAGRTAETALKASWAIARERYAGGKCGLCGGKALSCAERHAAGRSCA